ncbi:hypothetical protein ACIQCV_03965 [Dietzia maris]|uniref:hypothetical protein n=1 Tax=Dietzia kunjamensis TaxID=322509 RepID=UPI0022B55FE7|nr:hypothetical protein [Dietzia kunjamensis]MCZ4655660.1 hypothetical protein [Dietzia kunjamensis]
MTAPASAGAITELTAPTTRHAVNAAPARSGASSAVHTARTAEPVMYPTPKTPAEITVATREFPA